MSPIIATAPGRILNNEQDQSVILFSGSVVKKDLRSGSQRIIALREMIERMIYLEFFFFRGWTGQEKGERMDF